MISVPRKRGVAVISGRPYQLFWSVSHVVIVDKVDRTNSALILSIQLNTEIGSEQQALIYKKTNSSQVYSHCKLVSAQGGWMEKNEMPFASSRIYNKLPYLKEEQIKLAEKNNEWKIVVVILV